MLAPPPRPPAPDCEAPEDLTVLVLSDFLESVARRRACVVADVPNAGVDRKGR